MIDHVSIGVRDLARSAAFYDVVLRTIGFEKLADEPHTVGYGKSYPEFWLNRREGMARISDDTGVHVCLRARTPALVDAFHRTALENGAGEDGAPGLRPEYLDTYYAAFIRDPDGNRIEVVTYVGQS